MYTIAVNELVVNFLIFFGMAILLLAIVFCIYLYIQFKQIKQDAGQLQDLNAKRKALMFKLIDVHYKINALNAQRHYSQVEYRIKIDEAHLLLCSNEIDKADELLKQIGKRLNGEIT